MKKKILIILLGFTTVFTQAQEKGFFITAGGSLGMNKFQYKLDNDQKSSPKLGYGGALGVQYYFHPHWGVATGVGLSFYNSKATFSTSWKENPEYYSFDGMYDNDPLIPNEQYILRLGVNEWTETQQAYFLEVPLMLMYQTRWGAKKTFGMYFGIGAKAQIPVMNEEYKVEDQSQLSVVGYYPASGITLGEVYQRENYGFGKTNKTHYNGDLDLKTGFAASGEIGLLFDITPRVDLTVGAYFDYGFTDIKKGNKTDGGYLIEPEGGRKTIQPSDFIGDNLQYNGYVNSYAVDKVNLLACGAKVGIRIKLGQPKPRLTTEELEQLQKDKRSVSETHTSKTDTIFIIHTMPLDSLGHPMYYNYYNNNVTNNSSGQNEKAPAKEDLTFLSEPIFFDLNKDVLLPTSKQILDKKIAILEKYPQIHLLITGNTCDIGSGGYNLELGQRRARVAMKYLEEHGVNKSRMSCVSQSFTNPLAPNNNNDNREKNRRCDFYPTGY